MIDPALGDHLPYVTYFIAIALIAWLTTTPLAAVSLVLGWLLADYFFVGPNGLFAVSTPGTTYIVGTAAYFAVGATSIAVSHYMRLARHLEAEQRERLRTTLASIGDAVVATDTAGRITTMNAVAEALTGWTSADALGRPLDEVFRIVNENTREPVDNPAARALKEGTIVGLANHTVLISKDGTEWPIDDSAAPIVGEEGELIGSVLIFRDITARRRAEQALRESESLKTAIFETSLDCIISMDHTGKVVEFNPAAERIFGYKREETLGRELAVLIIPPALREAHRRGLARYLETGEGPVMNRRIEVNAIKADGSEFLVELTVTRIPTDGPPLFTAFVRDITGQKRMEDDLRKYAADLSEADRRKNEFLAMLAHELRNPLAPIRNSVEALRMTASDGSRTLPAADMIERQVDQLVRLVDDLLDVGRISRGKIDLRVEKVDLVSLIHNVVEAARSIHCDGHELSITLPGESIYVNADPVRIAQVAGNLLNNACKFTESGGRISLAVGREDGYAVIRVRDNGLGIEADRLPYIFDMFMQVDTSLERSGSGLGIGLTLVKNLVEMHGGSVEAHSAGVGRGSEFVVRLPVWKDEGETKPDQVFKSGPGEAVSNSGHSSGHRILVVEDNEDSAKSLEMLLKLNGNDTQIASDGLEAIGAAESFRPDVILMDIGLPKLNGYEACRRIRQQPWGEDILMIALTGWGQEGDRKKSRDAGFDSHLVKPVEFQALLKLLAELNGRKIQ